MTTDASPWITGTFVLSTGGDAVSLAAAGAEADGDDAGLHIPAEGFLRLVYGRLDAGHTPPCEAAGVSLD